MATSVRVKKRLRQLGVEEFDRGPWASEGNLMSWSRPWEDRQQAGSRQPRSRRFTSSLT